jgi:hypothetical protein
VIQLPMPTPKSAANLHRTNIKIGGRSQVVADVRSWS